jgi:IclR family KDG regulon transcriptional repressor
MWQGLQINGLTYKLIVFYLNPTPEYCEDTALSKEKTNRNGPYIVSTTLEKAFRIIEHIGERQPVFAPDIQRATGITKGNLYRLLATLEHLGYLHKNERGYSLSFKMFALGNTVPVTRDVVGSARRFLEGISADFGVSTYISIRDRLQMVNLDRVQPAADISISEEFAISYDLHCTASGKLALAHIDPAERRRFIDQIMLVPRTPYTITERSVLEKELEEIIARGYAVEKREHGPNINGVAAPIFNHLGAFTASLSAAAPAMILPEDSLDTIANRLVTDAAAISEMMGHETSQTALSHRRRP